jgi:hypothetical protein
MFSGNSLKKLLQAIVMITLLLLRGGPLCEPFLKLAVLPQLLLLNEV